IYKSPKELDFIPTVSFFKFFSILLSNGGQLETQKLIRESDPNKIGLVKVFIFSWMIHITDIEYAKSFLSESVHTIPKHELPPKTPLSIFLGKGISVSNRDVITISLTLRPDMVAECANEFITLLNKWTDIPIDVLSLMKRFTAQVLGKLAFKYDMKQKNESENTDLLAGILEYASHEEYNYTNKELRDDLDIQKKAREEVINVLGSASNLPTSENLKNLKYLTAIIMESLRLYPPAIITSYRKPTKPLNLSNKITIPKGANIAVNFWQIHRNPDIWNDADKFIPERFINPTKETKSSWIPFSIGPRNCLGQNFSMMGQKVVIALTLLNFEILLPLNAPHLDEIPLAKTLLLHPKKIDLIFS
ncbi:19598_t:CDS:2, partial [Gigaspora rosea]